jgi:hypothetical protein
VVEERYKAGRKILDMSDFTPTLNPTLELKATAIRNDRFFFIFCFHFRLVLDDDHENAASEGLPQGRLQKYAE